MKPAAVAILRQRAAAAGLPNARAHTGMIEGFGERFDVALALHAWCGRPEAAGHVGAPWRWCCTLNEAGAKAGVESRVEAGAEA
jgi:hypothetical protein